MTAILMLLFVVMIGPALMTVKLLNSLRTMEITIGWGTVLRRHENPFLFWTAIGLQCSGIGALLVVIYSGFFVLPNHLQVMS
jgi:hypothetical protein